MKKLLTLIALFGVGVFCAGSVFAYISPGKPVGHINDYTGTLTQDTKTRLEAFLYDLKNAGKGEVAVAVVATLNGDAIEDYANTLGREWGIGSKETSNGVLLLIAKDDRELRIEVGYGLEGELTDLKSHRIIDEVITPRFKEGDYNKGVEDGVREIVGVIAPGFVGSTQVVDYTQSENPLGASDSIIVICFFVVILWLKIIPLLPNKPLLRGLLGGMVGTASTLFISSTLVVFVLACVLAVLGIAGTKILPSAGGGSGSRWGGGSSSSGSSGGSFGGFGGGSFGGGGSSGRW